MMRIARAFLVVQNREQMVSRLGFGLAFVIVSVYFLARSIPPAKATRDLAGAGLSRIGRARPGTGIVPGGDSDDDVDEHTQRAFEVV